MSKPSIIDPFREAQVEQERKVADSVITRVQRLAKYSQPGSDIGIPWDLFEAYIEALSQRQVIHVGEWKARKSIAAPVFLPNEQSCLTSGNQGPVYVYPVIA